MHVERYNRIIYLALEIQQKRVEAKNHMRELGTLLTVSENESRWFERDDAVQAFKLLKEKVKIKPSNHVKETLEYEDLEIILHSRISEDAHNAMKMVLAHICKDDIRVLCEG